MNDYTSNSNKSKMETEDKNERGRLTPVAKGRKKSKSVAQKFADVFIADDIESVRNYVYDDIFKPTMKRIVSDIVDAILYGGNGPRGRRRDPNQSKVSYRRYYDEPDDRYYDDRSAKRDRQYSVLDYSNVIVSTREEAEEILRLLRETIKSYRCARVLDLYDLAEITPPTTSQKYGWTDLSSAEIIKVRDSRGVGYSFKMPKALPID